MEFLCLPGWVLEGRERRSRRSTLRDLEMRLEFHLGEVKSAALTLGGGIREVMMEFFPLPESVPGEWRALLSLFGVSGQGETR